MTPAEAYKQALREARKLKPASREAVLSWIERRAERLINKSKEIEEDLGYLPIENIVPGQFVIQNSAREVKSNPGFAASVAYKICYPTGNMQGYRLAAVTDGKILSYSSEEELLKKLNDGPTPKKTFRLLGTEELRIINRYLDGHYTVED